MNFSVIVLAAGQGTRMKSSLPKVLHPIAGAPMLFHALRSTAPLNPKRMIVVAGHGADDVRAALDASELSAQIVIQDKQLGTAHAAACAKAALSDFDGDAVVVFGDTPFVAPETFARIAEARADRSDLVVLGFDAENPGGYGRLVTDGDTLHRIVEAKDATEDELAITLCNSGIVAAPADLLFSLIDDVRPDNAQSEYYLTEIVAIARARGLTCKAVICDEAETLGVNSRIDLARAEDVFQDRARHNAMAGGATLTSPQTVFFAHDTILGRDVTIGPNTIFGPGVTIEDNVTIMGLCHIEGATLRSGATIGPFARLRPGADIGSGARIGNFVEVKAATIASDAKVNHLSYVGDAEVGERANIGAGTITCNYDGVFKHKTTIGADAFIGSNSSLVAPVTVSNGAFVGTATVVTKDVPEGDLAIGRVEQTNRRGMGARLMSRLRSLKAAGKRP